MTSPDTDGDDRIGFPLAGFPSLSSPADGGGQTEVSASPPMPSSPAPAPEAIPEARPGPVRPAVPPRRDDRNVPPAAARPNDVSVNDFGADWRPGEYRRPPARTGPTDLVRGIESTALYRIPRTNSKRKWIGWGAAGAAVLALAWLLWPSSDDDQAVDEATPPVPAAAPEDIAKLESLLPRGYPAGTCHPVPPKTGERAKLFCYRNTDPDGPSSATYALAEDKENLDGLMAHVIDEGHPVLCPGNVQSPGPWRRTANLSKSVGVLLCGVPDDVPTVAWTNDAALLVGIVATPGPRSATLAKLYDWWSKHS